MKEIDFLPSWYKQQQNQQISYRTKWVILGGVFFVIMTLNFTSTFTVYRMKSVIAKTEPQVKAAENISLEYATIQTKIDQIKKKEELLAKLDSKIKVPNVLGEISYLVDEKMVIEKLELTSEKMDNQQANAQGQPVAAVRTAVVSTGSETEDLHPDVRFKIHISGIAAGGSDVARLVCKIEDSKYFRNVVLLGSKPRSKKINSDGIEEDCQVNEFEISCYLANYEYKQAEVVTSAEPDINGRIR